ncbi:hypothetical protein CV102_00885 [Natronococcus pandeyae]|uniref:Uncharacterized protein n=1 Tax=Natronococcus pandeyae TaxID=2055836 RepID=A0A8J8Q929_9EURY|nr:hypothetical protein CV102_00885 [Natronococcus pandeyae]
MGSRPLAVRPSAALRAALRSFVPRTLVSTDLTGVRPTDSARHRSEVWPERTETSFPCTEREFHVTY